jgi:tyrosyl-tRNA synthetase
MAPEMNTSLYQDLEWRGLIRQSTDPDLGSVLEKSPLTLYCGFDPTADSLHLGSLLPLLTLKRFQNAGHRVIAVVGGATGMIGDPSFKAQERKFLTEELLQQNLAGIQKVIEKFLVPNGPQGTKVLNNFDWFKPLSFLDFLRLVGKHFTVNHMVAKESVRARLEDRDHGISYTEFSYMLLQAYDFYHLHQNENCQLQIGGSDQWGNITAGIELIRRMGAIDTTDESSSSKSAAAFGLTFPLVTKSDGTKFGKSETGTIWLSADKTSPYQFYQFLLQTSDDDVISYLKFFTFLSRSEIENLESLQKQEPEKRHAQKTLARELTLLVHGSEELKKAEDSASALFSSGGLKNLSVDQILRAFETAPKTDLPKADFSLLLDQPASLVELLVKTGLSPSKGQARKDIQGGGIYVNDDRIEDQNTKLNQGDALAGSLIVLRKGKKTYHLVRVT